MSNLAKKKSKVKVPELKGHGNGKISYKARTSSQKLSSFFGCKCSEEDNEKKKEEK